MRLTYTMCALTALAACLSVSAGALAADSNLPALPVDPPAATPAAVPATAPATPVAPAGTAPAATPAAAAPAAGTPEAPATAAAALMTDEQHFAKGEVRYGNAWVSIDSLFKDYLAAKVELKAIMDKANAPRDRLMDINRELAAIRSEGTAAERPIRAELGKARSKQREIQNILDDKPPPKPILKQLPPEPPRPRTRSSNSSYGSSTGNMSNGYDQAAEDRHREWQRTCQTINQSNQQLNQKYGQDLAEFNKKQADAKKQLPDIEKTVKDSEAKLAQLATDKQGKVAPVTDKTKAANEEVLSVDRQATAVKTRIENMANALRAAPEKVRLTHGILEWETDFYTLPQLEKLLNDTQADINRVHDELKAEATAASQPFPPNWRHPQQDRMDALKVLVDKAKAAQAVQPAQAAAKPAA